MFGGASRRRGVVHRTAAQGMREPLAPALETYEANALVPSERDHAGLYLGRRQGVNVLLADGVRRAQVATHWPAKLK
jgi:hypothetical protein